MGASRALIRKLKIDQDRRSLPENRRSKPGSPNRRVIKVLGVVFGREVYLHATKGVKTRVA
jgi:hypothetical protein